MDFIVCSSSHSNSLCLQWRILIPYYSPRNENFEFTCWNQILEFILYLNKNLKIYWSNKILLLLGWMTGVHRVGCHKESFKRHMTYILSGYSNIYKVIMSRISNTIYISVLGPHCCLFSYLHYLKIVVDMT
jgi:hypothetical protein